MGNVTCLLDCVANGNGLENGNKVKKGRGVHKGMMKKQLRGGLLDVQRQFD